MHFSDTASANSSKATKIATVVALHVVLGYGLISSMNTVRSPAKMVDRFIEVMPQIIKPEPPPPEPPKPKHVETPKMPVVPKPEVVVPQEPVKDAIVADVVEDPQPQPQQPAVAADPGPAVPAANPGNGIRTAVFAEGCTTPEYPTASLRNGEEGTVVLALMVNASGNVENSRVTKSSGSRALDKAAQNALSQCRFKPAMANGQPEAGWAQISYVWKLES